MIKVLIADDQELIRQSLQIVLNLSLIHISEPTRPY